MYSLRSVTVFLGILVLAVVAKPYHVKITKHSSSKSRDLSMRSKLHDMNSFVNDDDYDDELDPTHYVPMTDDKHKKVETVEPKKEVPNYFDNNIHDDDEEEEDDDDEVDDVDVSKVYKKKQQQNVDILEEKWKSWDAMHEDYGSDEYNGNVYEKDDDDVDENRADDALPDGVKTLDISDQKEDSWEKNDFKNELYGKNKLKPHKSWHKKVDNYDPKKPYDPCDAVFCHYGRVCKSYEDGAATCECGDESFCIGHSKKVCGSDGVWYPSHCELHRQACLKSLHISIDHNGQFCDDKLLTNKEKKPMIKELHKKKEKKIKLNKDSSEEVEPAQTIDAVKTKRVKIDLNDLYKDEKLKKELKHSHKEVNEDNKRKNKKQTRKDKKEKKKDKKKHNKKESPASTPEPDLDSNLLHSKKKDTEDIILGDSLKEKQVQEVTPTKPQQLPSSASPSPDEPTMLCSESEFSRLKDNLMLYHCARIGENDCYNLGSKKQYLANIMFHYYDRTANDLLDADELTDIEHQDHLGKLSQYCHLVDMYTFDDPNHDLNISMSEFYKAFDVLSVSLEKKLATFSSTVTVGNSLEIKCDVKGAVELVWKRNGGLISDITSNEVRVFADGSLYIGHVGLHHLGNYTCQDKENDDIVQTHILKVEMPPKARVNPDTQFHTTGSTVTLHCHVNGVPQPEITWEKNETPLPDDPSHYTMLYNNATLQIRTSTYKTDTGAYKCKARNKAGSDQDIGTVFIENNQVPKYSKEIEEEFMVFHDEGYSVYEPDHCNIEHQVSGTFHDFKRVPLYGSTIATLCPEDNVCSWGDSVNVKDEYIYVTQPKLNRVVVINIRDNHTPVELIQTDVTPVSIKYVSHLDQVWVVCWNGEENGGAKTLVVIRDAGIEVQHHTVHTQPMGDRFDLIKELFLPPANDLDHHFNYGYVVHDQQQGLYKIDLQALKYIHTIDLTLYKCVPINVAFLPIGGQVMVYCSAPEGEDPKFSRLVLDYITDHVLDYIELGGEPHVSPDSQYVVTLDTHTNTIAVYKVNDEGKLQHVFEEYTSFHVSDLTFFPSQRGHSYDFFASSADRNDLLYINLASGKIEMIEGIGEAIPPNDWLWSSKNRVIVGGGIFGGYLMTPSQHSVVVIDGRLRHVQCEWEELKHANVIVWIKPQSNL